MRKFSFTAQKIIVNRNPENNLNVLKKQIAKFQYLYRMKNIGILVYEKS